MTNKTDCKCAMPEVCPDHAHEHYAKPAPDGLEAVDNYDEVICPKCVHQFRAIPVNVQERITDLEAALRVARAALTQCRSVIEHNIQQNNIIESANPYFVSEVREAIAAIDALGITP